MNPPRARPALGGAKEGNVLFNDALNTFYFTVIYGVKHMVKDHSDSESGNSLPPQGLLFPIRVAHVPVAGFLSRYLSGPLPSCLTPHNRK